MAGVRIAIILGVIVGILVIFAFRMGRDRSMCESVITKFMEAGAAKDMGAAYACWSPHSVTEEGIAEIAIKGSAGEREGRLEDNWYPNRLDCLISYLAWHKSVRPI